MLTPRKPLFTFLCFFNCSSTDLAVFMGIANPIPLKWTHLKEYHENFDFRSFCDSIILSHLRLKRAPGTKFAYSNVNYLVLGRLIEEITGDSYENWVKKSILDKIATEQYIGFDINRRSTT